MRSKITRTIISDEDKEFKIGDDVHFWLNRNNKTYECFGVITRIDEEEFEVGNVQLDKMSLSDVLVINYAEVHNGIFNHTDNGWY